jgi:hypothetical protein
MIAWVVTITLAKLKNSTLPLARKIRRGPPFKMEGTETPKLMPFVNPLRLSMNYAHPKGVSLCWVSQKVVEHCSNINIPCLDFIKVPAERE